jgi:hypothetical protein
MLSAAEIREKYPTLSSQYTELRFKSVKLDLPNGKAVTLEEFAKVSAELPYGFYMHHDEIVGHIIHWHMPNPTHATEALSWCLSHINDYDAHRTQYKTYIETVPEVTWHLIFFLICNQNLNDSLPTLSEEDREALLENRTLFKALAEDGAKYQHYLFSAYGNTHISHLVQYFELYNENTVQTGHEALNFLAHTMVSHDENSLVAAQFALMAGIDINVHIDGVFKNTLLHYLIALAVSDKVICFLNLLIKERQIHTLRFTAQDAFGKTPLHLAIGMNLPDVVDALLGLHEHMKLDIGLNIADDHGRTPAMFAAALGQQDILTRIMKQEDLILSAVDKHGHDVNWHRSAPMEEIEAILRSVSVNPKRGCALELSHLYSESRGSRPWVLVDNHGEEHLLDMSVGNEALKLLSFAEDLAPDGIQKRFIQAQISTLKKSECTLAQKCKKNQPPARIVHGTEQKLTTFSGTEAQAVEDAANEQTSSTDLRK